MMTRPSSVVLATLLLNAFVCLSQESLAHSEQQRSQDISKVDWWKKTNFYHIYIRSFKDTDGNGQGDLRGIISELDYLKTIGVETLLLSPFYSSPMKDGGYDIDDYRAINPLFGTMKDFDELLAGLKRRGMYLVVDFVPNHSSNKHKWFECSERALIEPERCGRYKDYYVWSNSTRYLNFRPTNWLSLFGGQTAWRWSDIRKEFYLHQFLPEQPDLNLTNPLVREEFKEIVRFWLRKGVDGLRVDAVPHFLEDKQWRDEPQDPQWKPYLDPYDRLLHIYTKALSESVTVCKDWYDVAHEPEFGKNRVIITEGYGSIPDTMRYYGPSPDNRYTSMPFDFELLKLNEDNLEPGFIIRTINNWLNATRALGWPDEQGAISPWSCWVTGNHDNKRVANKVGVRNADAFRLIAYLLPGVAVGYYGDEIGMHDANFNAIPKRTVEEGEPTRLVFRAPMAWSAAEPSGGFSGTANTWMPLNTNYKINNVEKMLNASGKNHLKNFIQLQSIRRHFIETLTFGDLVFFSATNHIGMSKVLAMARTHEKFGNLLLLVNFDDYERETINLLTYRLSELRGEVISPPLKGKIIMLNYMSDGSKISEGTEVELQGLTLAPNQAVLIEYSSNGRPFKSLGEI